MQLSPETKETPEKVALNLTRSLNLFPGRHYRSDEDRLKAIKKQLKFDEYISFHTPSGNVVGLSYEKVGIKLSVIDLSSHLTFEYSASGTFLASKRVNLHAEKDGCTHLPRVGLPESEAKDYGDEILHLIADLKKDRSFNKQKLTFPRPVCIPKPL